MYFIDVVKAINYIIGIIFTVCYAYQFFYIIVPFLWKDQPHKETKLHRYAVMISARNEEKVIVNLIHTIQQQNYPSELVTVFVVADNCTDQTAEVCRKCGAVVYERFNKEKVGKGFALDFLMQKISEDYPKDTFDAYLVFDADNLLDENYISEMNKTFSDGHKIITSYRNSKNYGTNWISAGYALWFLRESRYLNHARMLLHTSCAVSGTGFCISREIIERNGGWKFYLLTEDIQFSVHSILQGEKVAFCSKAILYDEQPITFKASWNQRLRWSKGFLQVWGKYGKDLLRNIFSAKGTSCYDISMTIMPAFFLSVFALLMNCAALVIGVIFQYDVTPILKELWGMLVATYQMLFVIGTVTMITEWKNVHCSTAKKILSLFTFPIFMYTYIPISIAALFQKVDWKPIEHPEIKTLEEILTKK